MKNKRKMTAAILSCIMALGTASPLYGSEYNYDRAYGDVDGRIVYLSDKKDPALITPEKFYVFSSKGTMAYDTELDAGDIKAMFADESAAFYLTGETKEGTLTYYLHKVTCEGKKKSGKMVFKPEERSNAPLYTENFAPYSVKYSFYKNYVMFEVVPCTEKGEKAPLHFGFVRNSLSSFLHLEEDVAIKIVPQKPSDLPDNGPRRCGGGGGASGRSDYDPEVSSAVNIGGYDSVHYMAYLSDFALKNSSGVSLLFPRVYADGSLMREVENNERSGLFICDNEYPESTGDPLPKYSQPRLIVEAYGEDTLVLGDIHNYYNGVLVVGKDESAESNGYKNAFTAFYDNDVRKAKKTFITSYTAKDGVRTGTPYIKTYDGKTYIFWYETKDTETVMKYGRLNKNAELENITVINAAGLIPAEPMIRERLLYYVVEKDGQYNIARKKFP